MATPTTTPAKIKYTYARGRRKNAVAAVRLYEGKGDSMINNKPFAQYFPAKIDQKTVLSPLTALEKQTVFYFTVKATGGGVTGQKEAVRHALSRALIKVDPSYRLGLKPLGFLKRDPRMVERKKTGF